MQIWVDADACPAVIKDILYRAADRVQMQLTLVANQLLRVPPSRFIRSVQVPSGADTGGPAAFSQSDRQNFANSLDRHLAKRKHG